MAKGEYSVCQFFSPETQYEYVARFVDETTAGDKFLFFTRNVAAQLGITKRVVITDGGDCIVAEWKYGEGLVFPTPESIAAARKGTGE